MSKSQRGDPPGAIAMRVRSPEPGELLLRIARQRDREAFAEIYQRFEKQAFNLARNLTGDAELAEEAVQEGFLRIWLSAGSFREEGSAKGWMLRIIAGKSLQLRRSRRREKGRTGRVSRLAPGTAEAGNATEGSVETRELLATLRRLVGALPEQERRLLSLYYCGEFTQQEMADQLAIPQRTISHRLQAAVVKLQRELAGAGLAAALGDPGEGPLAEALQSGAAPADLQRRTLERIQGQAGAGSRGAAVGLAAGVGRALRTGWALLFSAGLTLAALTAGWAWLRPAGEEAEGASPVAGGTALNSKYFPGTPAAQGPLCHWSFQEGIPEDCRVVQGVLTWRRNPDGQGEGMARDPIRHPLAGTVMLLPAQVTPHPHLLTVRMNYSGSPLDFPGQGAITVGVSAHWMEQGAAVACRVQSIPLPVRRGEMKMHILLWGSRMIHQLDGQTTALMEFPTPYPSRQVSLALLNGDLREVTLERLEEQAMRMLLPHPEAESSRLRIKPGFCEFLQPPIPFQGGAP